MPLGPPSLQWMLFGLLTLALAASVYSDLRTRLIPNAVTASLWVCCLALRVGFEGVGDWNHGLWGGLLGSLTMAAPLGLQVGAWGGFGWGDVKLMAGAGMALGTARAVVGLVAVSLIGAVLAVVAVSRSERKVPYALAVAAGCAAAMGLDVYHWAVNA